MYTHRLALVFLLTGIVSCGDSAGAGREGGPGPTSEFSFAADAVGSLPKDFNAVSGKWEIVRDTTAPGDGQVLAQTAAGAASDFNLLLIDQPQYVDVGLSVTLRAVEGETDQGGGVVWRARDDKNYYLVRYNPLEKNYRLYRVVAGERKQLASADVELKPGWHTIAVQMRGDAIECFLDGRSQLVERDSTFPGPGRVGLWTKADARTSFDDLKVRMQR